jgi:3-hydroxybutyryl-CoA dehydrogenase
VAGLHFFNPVPLMKVVEVIRGERTSQEVVDTLAQFVSQSAHRPVLCADTPGFVVNHAGRGLYTEGLRIVREGVADFADVDRVMRDCAGFPMGPFELFDLTGIDVSSRVLREIYESFFHERRYQPSALVYRRVDAGLFGRKVGEGFYLYQDGRRIEPPEAEAPSHRKATFRVDAPREAARHIAAALASGGLTEVTVNADVVVVAPFGTDATTTATALKHDPRRLVAIDPMFSERLVEGGRATLMSTPVSARETADTIHAALLAAGLRVTRIADSPGFIAQRVLANIVNTACEIAQQRIATPADIEEGVKRGLGYPTGPLALGDRIGPARVMAILESLQSATGDQRYAPSLWLRRRAMLMASLATPE